MKKDKVAWIGLALIFVLWASWRVWVNHQHDLQLDAFWRHVECGETCDKAGGADSVKFDCLAKCDSQHGWQGYGKPEK